jgi:hypothetical protein
MNRKKQVIFLLAVLAVIVLYNLRPILLPSNIVIAPSFLNYTTASSPSIYMQDFCDPLHCRDIYLITSRLHTQDADFTYCRNNSLSGNIFIGGKGSSLGKTGDCKDQANIITCQPDEKTIQYTVRPLGTFFFESTQFYSCAGSQNG